MTDLALNEPWQSADRQKVATQFGMWAFLATETLFFGAIFLFYAVARWSNLSGFTDAAREANVWFGTANTLVLLTSSLTMAVGERATGIGAVALARAMFAATIVLGATFLVVKGFEYRSDIAERLLPGRHFKFAGAGARQFWSFYWVVTVVHATHLTIGLGVVGRLLLIPRDRLAARSTTAEGTALYWHLVDVVWVILYPLALPDRPRGVTRDERRHVVLAPLLVWAELLVLLGATLAYAYVPHAPLKVEAALTIGAAKAALIAMLFMQLRRASGLVRVAAVVGLCWASFLYLFAFADYLTR